MQENQYITTRKKGESLFDTLQSNSLECVQQLSGKVWTDFNLHDPGVTTLGILNYALTELDYRLRFPMADYLTAPDGTVDTDKLGLFSPKKIFSTNPVTLNDYRNLFLETLDSVEDIQICPYEPDERAVDCNGCYNLSVELSPFADKQDQNNESSLIKKQITRLYHSHRNLCENLHDVSFIKRKKLILNGNIEIDGSVKPEKILVTIYLEALKLFVSGTRYSKNDLPVFSLYKNIKNVAGITTIRTLEFTGAENDETFYTVALSAPDELKIRLFRNGNEIETNPAVVLQRLHSRINLRLAARHKKETTPHSVILNGKHRIMPHYSIQHDFPTCYAVNMKGVAPDETAERKVQIRQFKAYLLLFDLLFIKGLKEIGELSQWMKLTTLIPSNVNNLPHDPVFLENLLIDKQLATTNQPNRENSLEKSKDNLLDTLDKLYGEDSNRPFIRLLDTAANRNRRVNFLKQLPELIRDRFKGINLYELSDNGASGLERYLSALLGLEQQDKSVFVIEHLLLAPPSSVDDNSTPPTKQYTEPEPQENALPLEFTLSIIMEPNEQSSAYPDFNQRMKELLRERIPAHIQFEVYWLTTADIVTFRQHYIRWRTAYATNGRDNRNWYANILISCLIQLSKRKSSK